MTVHAELAISIANFIDRQAANHRGFEVLAETQDVDTIERNLRKMELNSYERAVSFYAGWATDILNRAR